MKDTEGAEGNRLEIVALSQNTKKAKSESYQRTKAAKSAFCTFCSYIHGKRSLLGPGFESREPAIAEPTVQPAPTDYPPDCSGGDGMNAL